MQQRNADREALIRSHINAIATTHGIEQTLAAFTRPRYEVPALGMVAEGREATSGFLAKLYGAFPDFRIEPELFIHGETAVAVEGKVHATQKGAWLHFPPSGKQAVVPLVMIYEFEGGDLVGEKVYFDHLTVLKQIGAM